MGSSPPGSPVHGILQGRILQWVAISFPIERPSRGLWMRSGKWRHEGAAEGCVPEPGGLCAVLQHLPCLRPSGPLTGKITRLIQSGEPSWFYSLILFPVSPFSQGLEFYSCIPTLIRSILHPTLGFSFLGTVLTTESAKRSWALQQPAELAVPPRPVPPGSPASLVQAESLGGNGTGEDHSYLGPASLPAPLARLQTSPGFSQPADSSANSRPAAITPAFPLLRGGNHGPCQSSETFVRWGCLSVYRAPLLSVRAQSMPLISKRLFFFF